VQAILETKASGARKETARTGAAAKNGSGIGMPMDPLNIALPAERWKDFLEAANER
jgi:hypothetical protein